MLQRTVERFFTDWMSMAGYNGRFLLAISGGADSLAMLHVVHSLFPADQLAVAHLDHGLRPDSGEDAAFVQETAVSHNMPCFIKKVDVGALARESGWSIEEAGRKARYQFFAEVAEAEGITAVLTAHNANDQAETVLMNLLRGSGMRGMRGIAAVGHLAQAPGIWLLRPLLMVDRVEIEAYCQQHQLQPRFDTSNEDTVYFRNRVRQELVPLLRTYNSRIQHHLQQTAVLLAADDDWLNELVDVAWTDVLLESGTGWLCLRREEWSERPLALRRRLLRRAITQVASAETEISFRTLEAARKLADEGQTGAQATLPAEVSLTVEYDCLRISSVGETQVEGPQITAVSPQSLPVPGQLTLANGWLLGASRVTQQTTNEIYENEDVWQAFVDVSNPLFVRSRLAGERIQPLGMNGRSSKIKDVMINRKLPAASRASWPIVVTETHPVWLVGHCLDERVRITAVSSNIVHLRCWRLLS